MVFVGCALVVNLDLGFVYNVQSGFDLRWDKLTVFVGRFVWIY